MSYREHLYTVEPDPDVRAILHMLVTHMPDDPDGIWCEMSDHPDPRYHLDYEDIRHLCQTYRYEMQEPSHV